MRRGLAGLILGISLVLASVAWSGFVLTHTVLDPGRSERLADQLLDNEVLREALVGRLAGAMGAALPPEFLVPDQQLEEAAAVALEDPRVEALVRDGIVRVHRNALEGNPEPVALDTTALGEASRDALVAVRPELAMVLPEAPPLTVELPTVGLSWLGRLRELAQQVSLLLGAVSLVGILLSLLVARNRPAVLRRVSFWAFGAAAFWLIVGYGIPVLARSLAPSSTAIASAMIDVFFGAMIPPAVTMGVFGAILLGASLLWASASERRGARVLQPGAASNGRGRQEVPAGRGRTTSNIRPIAAATATPDRAAPTGAAPRAEGGPRPRVDATQVLPVVPDARAPARPSASPTPTPTPTPTPHNAVPSAPRWVEGVGYVEDGSEKPASGPSTHSTIAERTFACSGSFRHSCLSPGHTRRSTDGSRPSGSDALGGTRASSPPWST
jgi:hypothetical protein